MDRLDRFFEISERRSTVGAELRGGLVTFIAMAYIIMLNPIILSSAPDVDGHKLDFAQVVGDHVTGRRGDDDPVRRRRAASVRVRRGPRHQLVPGDDGGRIGHLARGDGARGHQRPDHRAARGDGTAAAGLRRRADATQVRDHRRHRTVHLFIGLVDAGFVSSTGLPSPPVGLGTAASARSAPCRRSSSSFTLLVTGILVARKIRGGILIGLVSGTVVAVVIEAIWHLGLGRRQARRLEPVGARRCPGRRSRGPTSRSSASSACPASAGSACSPRSCWCSRWCSRTSSTRWAR